MDPKPYKIDVNEKADAELLVDFVRLLLSAAKSHATARVEAQEQAASEGTEVSIRLSIPETTQILEMILKQPDESSRIHATAGLVAACGWWLGIVAGNMAESLRGYGLEVDAVDLVNGYSKCIDLAVRKGRMRLVPQEIESTAPRPLRKGRRS